VPLLTVKSLGFSSQATLYHVYEVPMAGVTSPVANGTPSVAPAPAASAPASNAVALPKPLTPQPIDKTEFELKSFAFGVQRCFYVRPVDVIFGMSVQGPKSPETCVTPVDTFPPLAPRSLAAIRRGRCHQPDLGPEQRTRSRWLHRVARRSAGVTDCCR
jgi:hypothetical protein